MSFQFDHDMLGRTFGLANVDIVAIMLAAYGISKVANVSFPKTVFTLFLLGEAIHMSTNTQSGIHRHIVGLNVPDTTNLTPAQQPSFTTLPVNVAYVPM